MRLCCTLLVVVLAVCPAALSAEEPPPLATARALYNAGRYDEAIESATAARSQPSFADAAALVIARAYIERYRQGGAADDLARARGTLADIHAAALSARDRIDLLIGLGQTLFLADRFGAAAEIFDSALGRAAPLDGRDRLLLLDWWATAIDREARLRPPDSRPALFIRIGQRMEAELRDDPGSVVANYWLPAAALGEGNAARAWDAAVAAWVRSRMSAEGMETLRADLDRLVTHAIIPERTRAEPAASRQGAADALGADWEQIKRNWE